jgi:hypothetical protein
MEVFILFAKGYSKHKTAYIFWIKKLDLVGVIQSFGFQQLPWMLKLKDVPHNVWKDVDSDVSLIPVYSV